MEKSFNAVCQRLGLEEDNETVRFLVDKVEEMSEADARAFLAKTCEESSSDPNFPARLLEPVDNVKLEAVLIKYHSAYPEVRAVTDPIDDEDLETETWRAYTLGLVWVVIGSAINTFFMTRQPSIEVSAPLLQLVIFPCGRLLQKLCAKPWNSKEQMLATIMFNITLGLPYVTSQIFVQKLDVFYGNEWATVGYQFLLVLSTQLLGFGIAGLMRRVLVYPAECVWPGNLPTLALNRALMMSSSADGNATVNGWSLTRYRFFLICFGISAVYYWFPDYLFQALSNFNWLTWIAPHNLKLNIVTGMYGLGINPWPTFDWNIINRDACLVTPFFAFANHMIGVLLSGAVVIPLLYWQNVKWTKFLPINSNRLFTNTGAPFKVKEILTDQGKFDVAKYNKYSPPFYSAASLVVYGAFFMYYPASVVYSLLYHRKVIVHGLEMFKTFWKEEHPSNDGTDPHCRMMSKYREAPNWWYLSVLCISLALGIACVKCYPTETPVWGIFMSLGVGILFLIPIGLMKAITNMSVGLNVLTELIAGYALPGNGTAMMIIKAFGFNTNAQALHFVSDLKLGHYAKLPPRAVFRAQVISSLLSAVVTIGVANWQMANYTSICQPDQPQRFTCPGETTYFSASIVWGVIGPKKVFGGLYPMLKYCFLIGCFVPLPFYALDKLNVKPFKFVHPLVIMVGMMSYAPYSMAFHLVGFYACAGFKYIKTRYPGWHARYTYVLSGALDSGVALAAIIIFFAVNYRPKTVSWWGNTVSKSGFDGSPSAQMPLMNVTSGRKFGPSVYP